MQFARSVTGMTTGQMDTSLFTRRPVSYGLLKRLPAILEPAIYATIVAVAGGIPLGAVAALWRNSRLDHAVRVVTVRDLAMAALGLA